MAEGCRLVVLVTCSWVGADPEARLSEIADALVADGSRVGATIFVRSRQLAARPQPTTGLHKKKGRAEAGLRSSGAKAALQSKVHCSQGRVATICDSSQDRLAVHSTMPISMDNNEPAACVMSCDAQACTPASGMVGPLAVCSHLRSSSNESHLRQSVFEGCWAPT